MPRSDFVSPGLRETLVAPAPRTTSGSTAAMIGWGATRTLRAQLGVSAFAGTLPTLDVVIEDTLDDGATWNTIASFAQKAATGREVLNYTGLFGETLRVRWTIGGSATPSFTFTVDCYSE